MRIRKELFSMKKVLKFEWLISIIAIPILWFLFSKSATFVYDLIGIELIKADCIVAVAVSELLVVVFREKIAAYLQFEIKQKAIVFLLVLSFFLTILFPGVFLRGCMAGGDILCYIGAALLFGAFLILLFENFKYLFSRAKTVCVSKKNIIFAGAVLVAINLAAVLYCSFLKKIFTWDNAGYFTNVHQFDAMFPWPSYWKAVYQSVFETDYNYVIMIPASFMCKLFGKSRLVFVLSIINFYVYPILMLVYLCGKRYFHLSNWKIICVYLCLPFLIFAANTGFIDVGGIVPILLALILYYFGRGEKHSILIGVLLALAIYMRRWYSFFALSFVVTVFLHGITRKNIRCFLEILGSFAFVLLFFTQDFVSGKLLADYRYIYSAYNLGIRTDVMIFTRYYGVLMSCGICLFVVGKQIYNRKKLQIETFVLFQAMVMFSLFVSVQTHGQQHLSLYIPAFFILLLSFMECVNKKYAIIAVASVSAFQSVNTLIPRVQPTSIGEIKRAAITPNFSNYPPVDYNVENILEITKYMDQQIGEHGKSVCFLSSSLNLNYETLKNAEVSVSVKKPSQIDRASYYYSISDVDKRDGLSERLFQTDYILVPSTLQIHLAEEEQRVISVPYYEIINQTGIGTAYRKETVSFSLADGTEIFLYRRTREITREEIKAVKEQIFNSELAQ